MKKIRSCVKCTEYTMEEQHCSQPTLSAYPAKFSPEDKYAKYRQKARQLKTSSV